MKMSDEIRIMSWMLAHYDAAYTLEVLVDEAMEEFAELKPEREDLQRWAGAAKAELT